MNFYWGRSVDVAKQWRFVLIFQIRVFNLVKYLLRRLPKWFAWMRPWRNGRGSWKIKRIRNRVMLTKYWIKRWCWRWNKRERVKRGIQEGKGIRRTKQAETASQYLFWSMSCSLPCHVKLWYALSVPVRYPKSQENNNKMVADSIWFEHKQTSSSHSWEIKKLNCQLFVAVFVNGEIKQVFFISLFQNNKFELRLPFSFWT